MGYLGCDFHTEVGTCSCYHVFFTNICTFITHMFLTTCIKSVQSTGQTLMLVGMYLPPIIKLNIYAHYILCSNSEFLLIWLAITLRHKYMLQLNDDSRGVGSKN